MAEQAKKEFDAEAEIAKVRADVMAAPAPGTDLDSKQRIAKTLAATPGVDVPAGFSVDPITTEDRERAVADAAKERKKVMTKQAASGSDQGAKADESKTSSTRNDDGRGAPTGAKASGDSTGAGDKAAGGDKTADKTTKPDPKVGQSTSTSTSTGTSPDDATARARRTTPQGRTTRPTNNGS